MSKKTILKTIECFFKNHKEEKPVDPTIEKPTKRSILKIVDTEQNRADRTTDTTFPVPAEPVINEASNNFKVKQNDYEITDLTKVEEIKDDEVKPPRDDDFDINSILNDLDDKLDENDMHHVLNILTTRSSKDSFKESALVEFSIADKSYVMSLIVEKEDENYKYSLKSSYGKEIYTKTVSADKLNEAVYFPFRAIALREKFNKLNETVDSDRMGEIMTDVETYIDNVLNAGTEPEDRINVAYTDNPTDNQVTFDTGSKAYMEMLRDYVSNNYPELEVTEIAEEDGKFAFSIK